VTLAFALASALILSVVGVLLYDRMESSLDDSVTTGLEARLANVAALVEQGGRGVGVRSALAESDETLAQVLDDEAEVVDGDKPAVITPAEVAAVRDGQTLRLERAAAPGVEGAARLLATRISSPAEPRVIVVGASLADRDEALRNLLRLLLILGPILLITTSGLGYLVARAALRPVEEIRSEAEAVSGTEPGRRLPVPVAQDELRRLSETLNVMLGRLEDTAARERTFIADASHELRTPLTLLRAEIELALARPRSTDELEAALRSAGGEVDRLSRLADDLLLLARTADGTVPLLRDAVRPAELLDRVAARFRPRAAAAGRTIEVSAPAALTISADGLRLEQAVSNLVSNALDYGAGSVELTARAGDEWVEIHVRDHGQGFPPDLLAHAFERFTRGDDAQATGGAGLGLAIVEVVAQAHTGTAHATTHVGGGADVWLALPGQRFQGGAASGSIP
jgi:two-component system, OmpR family, sensor kinase